MSPRPPDLDYRLCQLWGTLIGGVACTLLPCLLALGNPLALLILAPIWVGFYVVGQGCLIWTVSQSVYGAYEIGFGKWRAAFVVGGVVASIGFIASTLCFLLLFRN